MKRPVWVALTVAVFSWGWLAAPAALKGRPGRPYPEPHAYNLARIYSAAIFALLTYTSWIQAETKRSAGSYVMELGAKVPIWPGYYLLPIGLGAMTLVLVYQLAVYFSGAQSGLGDTDPWTSRRDDQLEMI